MNRSEGEPGSLPSHLRQPRYGRYVGGLALVILVLITLNTALTTPNGARGIAAGHQVPPFAAPLAIGKLQGDVDVATHPNEGPAGKHPACTVRGREVLNICERYEQGPVVLAIFVYSGSCERVLADMQSLSASFPGVSFAAVALKGEAAALRKLVRKRGLTNVQVAFDSSGVLAGLYKVASCPQVSLVLPGGATHGSALLGKPSRATLRSRIVGLVSAAQANGWKEPAR